MGSHPAQRVGDRHRVDDDARVEQAPRVPQRLEVAERARASRARTSAAAGHPARARRRARPEREPPWRDDQVGGRLHEAAEALLAAGLVQPEADPQVDAALAEVAVGDAAHPLVAEQLVELREVAGQPLRWHGRVLEPRPGRGAIGQPGRVARAVLADAPQGGLRRGRGQQPDVAGAFGAAQGAGQPERVLAGGGRVVATGLDEQPGTGGHRQQLLGWPLPHEREQLPGQALDGVRPLRQQRGDRRSGRDVVREAEHQEAPRDRWLPQAQRGARDDDARPLGAHERPRDVEAAFGQQPVERVPRDTPRPGRSARSGAAPRGRRRTGGAARP